MYQTQRMKLNPHPDSLVYFPRRDFATTDNHGTLPKIQTTPLYKPERSDLKRDRPVSTQKPAGMYGARAGQEPRDGDPGCTDPRRILIPCAALYKEGYRGFTQFSRLQPGISGRNCLDFLPLGDFCSLSTKPKNMLTVVDVHGEPSRTTHPESGALLLCGLGVFHA